MIHLIGDITLTLTVLLLAIMNYQNGKKIEKLEKRIYMLEHMLKRVFMPMYRKENYLKRREP